jgi:glyoxylase-like metal-dependent hydrolase (beta-lactamase superfamily II)
MKEIAPGVVRIPTSFVNSYFVGYPAGPWVLIDTGLPGFGWKIKAAAAHRFGEGSRPEAILLTHGHFDHAGNARQLSEEWGAPIYAHRLEMPYLTGRSDYPPPDPTVGGCIAQLSRVLPYGARDLGPSLHVLASDTDEAADPAESGPVPGLPGWRWLLTPGHSSGHVVFGREMDRVLIAGDAIATFNMDSYIGMVTEKQELARAGTPFICDWEQAARSVAILAELEPQTLACGHGTPMSGDSLVEDLRSFADKFQPPSTGRYVAQPVQADERGVDWLPPRPADPVPYVLAAAIGGLVLGLTLKPRHRKRRTRGFWR